MKINWNMEHGRRTNWSLQISKFFLPETPSFLLFSRRLGVSGGEINGYISLAGDWRMEELRSPCLKFIRVDSSPLLKMFVVRRRRTYTGCCKTSVKLCKPFCDTFLGVIFLFFCSFDCQIWAIFPFGTLWLWKLTNFFENIILKKC